MGRTTCLRMFRRLQIVKVFLLTGTLLMCMAARAVSLSSGASVERRDSVFRLRELFVLSRPYAAIVSSQQLAGETLQRLNAHSVADALRYFAGVQLKDYGGMGGLKTIDVRNMGSQHVGVFYDGIQLGNAQNGVVDLGRFSLDDLTSVSLYNGQKSDIFQSAKDFSAASSVYLQSRKPSFSKGKHTNLIMRYKAASIQLANPSFRWEQRLNAHVSMSVSGEYVHSNGRYKFRYRRVNQLGETAYDTMAVRKNSDITAYRAEAGVYGQYARGEWEGKLYYYDSDRGLPGAIVKNVWQSGERQGDRNFFAQTAWTHTVTPFYKLKLSGKYAYDYTHYLSNDTVYFLQEQVVRKMQYDNVYRQQSAYFSMIHGFELRPWWGLSWATDVEYAKLDAVQKGVGTPFTFPRRTTLMTALATALQRGGWKAQVSLLQTYVLERVKNNYKAPNKRELSPAVYMSWKPWEKEDFTLRAFYKRIFRMPTFNDLYYTQIGYSQLKPEFTDQIDGGFTWRKTFQNAFLKVLSVQADGYLAFITDKIIASPTGSSFRWMMSNMGKVKSRGVDVSSQLAGFVGPVEWNTRLTYSFARAQDFTKINGMKMSSYGDQIPYTPRHSGSATAELDYKGWGLNYSFIYVGGRYNGAVNNIERNYVQPWYTHDFSLQKVWTLWKVYRLKTMVEMNNAFNQYYDVVLNYPMPGRTFRFIISMTI